MLYRVVGKGVEHGISTVLGLPLLLNGLSFNVWAAYQHALVKLSSDSFLLLASVMLFPALYTPPQVYDCLVMSVLEQGLRLNLGDNARNHGRIKVLKDTHVFGRFLCWRLF